MVTCEPSACHAAAISTATTPPPITARRSGTSRGAGRLRLSPGTDVAEPRQIRQSRVGAGAHGDRMSGGEPDGLSLSRLHRDLPRAIQPAESTDELDGHGVQPVHLIVVLPVVRQLCPDGPRRPRRPRIADGLAQRWDTAASAQAVVGRSRALLGSHARNEHSPPRSSLSTITVESPASLGAFRQILAARTSGEDGHVIRARSFAHHDPHDSSGAAYSRVGGGVRHGKAALGPATGSGRGGHREACGSRWAVPASAARSERHPKAPLPLCPPFRT